MYPWKGWPDSNRHLQVADLVHYPFVLQPLRSGRWEFVVPSVLSFGGRLAQKSRPQADLARALFHLALAALRAVLERCSGVSFLAVALPPILPRATAAG